MTQSYETHQIIWNGIEVEIHYTPNWSNVLQKGHGATLAHIEIKSITPKRTPLPITETGYKSLFLNSETVTEAGGAESFIFGVLNQAAQSEGWKRLDAQLRQGELF